jgi:hypothetical protein
LESGHTRGTMEVVNIPIGYLRDHDV